MAIKSGFLTGLVSESVERLRIIVQLVGGGGRQEGV